MHIRPITDLSDYNSVLNEVTLGSPVYLTKDGVDSYVIVDIKEQIENEKNRAALKLMQELNNGIKSGEEDGWLNEEDIRQFLNKKYNE